MRLKASNYIRAAIQLSTCPRIQLFRWPKIIQIRFNRQKSMTRRNRFSYGRGSSYSMAFQSNARLCSQSHDTGFRVDHEFGT